MKIVITDIDNLAGDGISRTLNTETDFELHILSNKIRNTIKAEKLIVYPVELDDYKEVKSIIYKVKPDLIIFSNDYGGLSSNDKINMQKYNIQNFENITSISRVLDSDLMTISNEFIFDGKSGPYSEDNKPGSTNYYGKTKHAMENLAITSVNNCTVVRHSLLYGHRMYDYPDFPNDMVNSLKQNKKFLIKDNYSTTPVLVEEFAGMIIKLIEKKKIWSLPCRWS